jgi:hypothetical protein
MEKTITCNKKTVSFRSATLDDAQRIVDYIHIVAGETDNLSFGADAVPITTESEIEYLTSLMDSKTSAHFVAVCDHRLFQHKR